MDWVSFDKGIKTANGVAAKYTVKYLDSNKGCICSAEIEEVCFTWEFMFPLLADVHNIWAKNIEQLLAGKVKAKVFLGVVDEIMPDGFSPHLVFEGFGLYPVYPDREKKIFLFASSAQDWIDLWKSRLTN